MIPRISVIDIKAYPLKKVCIYRIPQFRLKAEMDRVQQERGIVRS